jgi:hypothetical protein
VYLHSSTEGQAQWQKLKKDPDLGPLIAWYAKSGLVPRGDFFFDGRQRRDAYLIPFNESPLVDPQATAISPDAIAHALEGEAVYLYFVRSSSRPSDFLWVIIRSKMQNEARVLRLEIGAQYLEYNSVTETLTKGKLSADELGVSPDFNLSQIGDVWNCLLAYLGLSNVSDLFSLINDYCNLNSGVQTVAEMVNGCVNPLNAVNCVIGVGAFLGCAIGNVGSCVNQNNLPTANLEVSFNPNPTYAVDISDCGGAGYLFTFTLSETAGVGFTPSTLSIDGNTSWAPNGFTQHVNGDGSIPWSLEWCRGPGSSTWTVTATDDNGHNVTASATLLMQ